MTQENEGGDRRVNRTRRLIFDAFAHQVLTRRYHEIRVVDIIDAADIGRSTFYEHFKSKDDVLLTSIEPLFVVLANCAAGKPDRERIKFVLEHFWEQRAFARVILSSELFFKLSRKLADMIELQMINHEMPRLNAVSQSMLILGSLKAWLAGEFSINAETFATFLMSQNKEMD